MKRKLLMTLALAGMSLAFTGCETPVVDHGAYLPINVEVNDLENRAGIVLLSRRVQNSVTCPGIQETRLPDGRLQVVAHLRNRENRRIEVQANCEFKDAQGFVLDSTPFQTVFLDENAQQDVRFVAINPGALRYTIRVREAR
ncbi:MAG TPA: YcfL family protein [Verrucomicrobia bacterium]|nr:YcfL family protein [Verrucomicrobiota bacterium]HOP95929.1 YcfL family protein [Verrucomicrobiota bacterium]HPU57021.1 YcfL family protein [Verrucomicrobiota bacterium]